MSAMTSRRRRRRWWRYAARLLGLAPPPEIAIEAAALTPMAQSFFSELKRVSNRLVKDELGYRFRHPTYREGLASLLD